MGKNGRILFDRPKPTVGCSASGRRRRRTVQYNVHLVGVLKKRLMLHDSPYKRDHFAF
jgi:hypothetical protein